MDTQHSAAQSPPKIVTLITSSPAASPSSLDTPSAEAGPSSQPPTIRKKRSRLEALTSAMRKPGKDKESAKGKESGKGK